VAEDGFVAGGRALDSFEERRHDRAHEQVVDPALGLDAGGEFLERDLVEAGSRVAWALGQIIEAELEDGLGGHATKVWTDEFDFAGTSHWHIDIAHAPGWGRRSGT
jgi:hypothetical protein